MQIGAKRIICDIEGTTTSIDFVKNVLFPYSHINVENYLKNNWKNAIVTNIVQEILDSSDKPSDAPNVPENCDETEKIKSVSNLVRYLIEKDSKMSPLKALQGLMWDEGFKKGKFKGHVFDDVPKAFELWTNSDIKIYIYSSGSVKAQRLLFEYSIYGNLLKYISDNFDTAVGPKNSAKSYYNILLQMGFECGSNVVFFTDKPDEAYAAKGIGIKCVLLDRPGNQTLSNEVKKDFPVITSFDQIDLVHKLN